MWWRSGGEQITATAPTIARFTAAPASITAGQSATLSWTVSGATTTSIDNGVGSVAGSSLAVSPTTTTTYTLTASGAGGTVTASATVNVVDPAVIGDFAATPAAITSDQGSTLSWTVSGATTVSIDNGIGAVTGTSVAVMPATTTTYTLTAANALGAVVSAATTVTVAEGANGVVLTWLDGSSVKLEQLIGDVDWADAARGITTPTTSQTTTRYNIHGTDIGYSFEDDGRVLFAFGDTRSLDPGAVNFHAGDPVAWSTSTDGDAGLLLNFFTRSNGLPMFVTPPGVAMGADDVPNAGITLPDGTYLVCNVGADITQPNPHENGYSVLVRFDEASQAFTTGRTISHAQGGHFVVTSLHASGPDVLMFGLGQYRASDVYLAKTPATTFWDGTGTQYFAGIVSGQPTWSASEADAVPVVQDNPMNGPPWPNDNPTVGNVAVGWSADLGLWIMTFDGGRQSTGTRGTYFTYAPQPWGPWTRPQLIFNDVRDHARGVFIHNPAAVPGDGLTGPTIGTNDPVTTPGGAYAPQLIERFTRVDGSVLKIYYTLSTWNPYTVVKMRSEFAITRP